MDAIIIQVSGKDVIFDSDDESRVRAFMPFFISKSGYLYKTIKGRGIYIHKWLLGLHFNRCYVDHKNRNTLDCRKSNLRPCTQSENLVNKPKVTSRPHKSEYKGVAWSGIRKKWIARISYRKKEIYGGGFETEIEAAVKANELYKEYYGQFAMLNTIAEAAH